MKAGHITILVLLFFSCCSSGKTKDSASQPKEAILQNNDSTISPMKEILKVQLQKGVSGLYDNSFDIKTYDFTEKDLNAIIPYMDNILRKNGYIQPTQEEFKKSVFKFFGRRLDYNIESAYIGIYADVPYKYKKELSFYRNTNNVDLNPSIYYIVKGGRFMTSLFSIPEVVDYKNLFPENYAHELEMKPYYYDAENNKIKINKWAELDDLAIQQKNNLNTFVHRNKYLFNNNQSSLTWLFNNDTVFIKSLVTIFGYTQDKKLLKWVIENNRFQTKNGESNGLEYGEMLWSRDYSGKINFHKEVLDVMQANLTPSNTGYIDDLLEYIEYLESSSEQESLTFKNKAFIIGNILHFVQSIAEQEEYRQFEFRAMGRFYKYHGNLYDREFANNKYYGLDRFETMWQLAKKNGDGVEFAPE